MTVRLARLEAGAGRPLLFLHGLFGNGRNWNSVGRQLAAGGWRCVMPDARNHGASPWAEPTSYGAMAGDVLGLMDELGIGRATLVGHSMGGKTALALALDRPARVERLVLVDIAPVAYPEGQRPYLDAMLGLDLGQVRTRRDADEALRASVPDAALRGFLLQNLAQEGERRVWRLNLRALARDLPLLTGFPAELADARYDGPATVIRGELSDYVLPAYEPALRRHLPQVAIRTIAGAAHWPHAERPEPFMAALRQALGAG